MLPNGWRCGPRKPLGAFCGPYPEPLSPFCGAVSGCPTPDAGSPQLESNDPSSSIQAIHKRKLKTSPTPTHSMGAGSVAITTPAAKAKASSAHCAHTATATAATHKARATGHACRVERWRMGRLRAALRRMGLLLDGDGEGLDAGLRKLAALRHPCLLGLYDPVGYGEREECSPQEEERSVCVVMEAGPWGAAVVCAGKDGGDCGLLARRLLEGGHEEVCTYLERERECVCG